MGSGDPSGLQNRRELALLALVSSTLTRFRQSGIPQRVHHGATRGCDVRSASNAALSLRKFSRSLPAFGLQ
jgi:hypothetical protein